MAHELAPAAEADLDDIWNYVAVRSGSMEIADRLIDSITELPVIRTSGDGEIRIYGRAFGVLLSASTSSSTA